MTAAREPGGHDVRDLSLADEGVRRVEWADRQMPVLAAIRARFAHERPLRGRRVSACLDVTAETANLMRTLRAGGADVVLCGSSSLSTQDEVAAALTARYEVPTFAIRGERDDSHFAHIYAAVDHRPQVTLDAGADVIGVLHTHRREQMGDIVAATEQTRTGVLRVRAMERDGILGFPVIAVDDARTKHLFDNRYGTGQSTIDGILRATNALLAGQVMVVAGYGWCGKGIALRARGMGARVVVCEVDPLRSLEAVMDGLEVLPMQRAAAIADILCTATGGRAVIGPAHFERMRDSTLLANSGHSNVEIDLPGLRAMSVGPAPAREHVEGFELRDGRRLYLLTDGRPVNLAAGEGQPPAVMDMSLANQALSVEWALQHPGSLTRAVHAVPREIDDEIARLKLASMGIEIDRLSESQQRYLDSWEPGA
ncbi:MAG TPA: adenosylhomocysteinase [Gaiellales bacterium]